MSNESAPSRATVKPKSTSPIVLAQMLFASVVCVSASVCLILNVWIPGFALLLLGTVLSLFPYAPKAR